MASGEFIFVTKSGQSLRVPSPHSQTEEEFRDAVAMYASDALVDGEVLVERDSSGDLVVLPVSSIDYIRGRWSA